MLITKCGAQHAKGIGASQAFALIRKMWFYGE